MHEVLADVLQPRRLAAALDLAVQQCADGDDQREVLTRQLQRVEGELVNLSETAARGGGVPAILNALARRDDERCRLLADLATLEHRPRLKPAVVKQQLKAFLDDWSGLLTASLTEARPVLSVVLAGDRIGFTPTADGGYELRVPIALDQVMTAAVPEFGRLQDMGTSPVGFALTGLASHPRRLGGILPVVA